MLMDCNDEKDTCWKQSKHYLKISKQSMVMKLQNFGMKDRLKFNLVDFLC